MIYLVTAEPDDNDTLLITCPAFPEVTTFAESEDEVPLRARAALEEAIAARIAAGEDIPADDTGKRHRDRIIVHLPLMTTLKVQLYQELRRSHVKTRAELARRMNKPRETIDRLFRLDHASKTEQIESAFHALDKDIEIRIH